MQTHKMLLGFGAMLLFGIISCSNDTASPSGGNLSIPSDDAWVITKFVDKGNDETSDYNAYTFFFKNGNVFEAVQNGNTTTGTWSKGTDDGLPRLNLSIAQTSPLDELNDDWVIVSSSDNLIRLQDDNDEHNEELVFER